MSISDRISALSPAQRELFESLRKKSASARPARPEPPPLVRRPPGDAGPLAIEQERLWFLHQLDPADISFNISLATRLEGRLDLRVVAGSLSEIVRRHEAWRTTFPALDGSPVQVVAPPAPVPLSLIDLSRLPEERRQAEAGRVSQDVLRLPFDLSRGPLLRAWLIRLQPHLHEFGLAAHHIVTDGYSSQIFWSELAALYPALAAGRPSPLPELPVQYMDFAVWQRSLLSGEALQEHLDYWMEHLAGAPLVLDLPTDRPRPVHATTRGRRIPLALSRHRTAGLKAWSQGRQVTPFMTLLALFQVLLSRQAGQERVIVASPNLNRNRPELYQLLGFFLTQLVFCTDTGGDPPFPELLDRVRKVALGAFAHQDLPFGKLVEALRPERDTSRPPVAQVTLLVQEAPAAGAASIPGGLRMTAMALDPGAAASELTLTLHGGPDGYDGYLEFNADLFDGTTVARLGEGFLTLVDAVLAGSQAPLSALPLLSEAAAHQVLREWNDTGIVADLAPVDRRFAAQAARTPEAVAIVDGTESWTYRELAGRAAELAARLRCLGVGPEARVAVCLPRSAELVASLLGVLTAGAAYVPLDPAYPSERLRFMLDDCGAAALVTEPDLESALFTDLPIPRVAPPAAASEPAPAWRSEANGAGPGHLAYLMYTSGSTGLPKATGITHHNLSAFLSWSAGCFPELAGGILFSTSVCFDLSVFEMFATLSCGGRLIVAQNVLALPDLPAAGEVELINTVPSAMTELLRLAPLPSSVRTITLCGEPFSRRLADEIEARGIRRPINLYGPTEDTVFSTVVQVPRREVLEPSIGRSILASRAFLLDRSLRPVPLGARGELYLAGDQLARGYLGRPELTAERFVPDPFTERPGERLYRTGDLARWRSRGEMEFLGRADRQVKVRGFRVEPAEIEALLAAHPDVREAVVAVRDGRLAAWVVPRGEAVPDLRGMLLERLPRHMIPALWTTLAALPFTPNGKVDYRALPAPEAPEAGDGAPRTPAEEQLAALWAEVLGLPRVGVHDNFFRLGGDSILSIRVVARARQAGFDLTPRQIFERQTVAELAAAATSLGRPLDSRVGPEEPGLPRPDPETLDRLGGGRTAGHRVEDAYPLSPLQSGLLFHGIYAPSAEIYFEQLACTIRGDLDAGAFRRAWQRLVDRHGILRTAFAWEELDEPLQVVYGGVELPWIEEDWRGSGDPDAQLAAFAAADRHQAFDLRRAPLLRAALLCTGDREHRFVWSFHHLLLDGWSLPVVFGEVFALYESERQGGTADPLPAPALPYRDFVAWLARRDRAADERYWRQALAGISGPTQLPWDAPAPVSRQAERADEFTQHEVLLPQPVTAALESFARERGLTLNTLVQGAWGLLLSRWSGEREVVFGAVAAGRPPELPGFETAIGLFINTLPVRLDADPERPLAGWLAALQSAQIEARQHEQAPLAEVQRWSGVPAREPLFQSLLAFENYPLDPTLADRTGALELTDLRFVERTSYPLSLSAVPGRTLRLRITHDRRLEPATGERLQGWLIHLLDRFVTGPELPLAAFDLLSEAERSRILEDWSGTPGRAAEPALQRFERWVAATPDAPAVRDFAGSLTFAELDRRAARLAGALRSDRIGPESRVALAVGRSSDLLVGILGIWKVGAAWVPLDPSHPRERTATLLRGCGAAALVTSQGALDALPQGFPSIVWLDNLPEAPAEPAAPLQAANAAYVLYTSGSTGEPKGVVVDHAALAGYLAWVDEILLRPVGFRLPATSGLTFDASLKQLLGPLLAGREVRILPEEIATQPVALVNAMAREGFAAFNGVPALWSAMLEAIESGVAPAPEGLESVLLGGEAVSPALVERTHRLLPRVEIWNLYGPTEATANATATRLSAGDPVTLGRPLPGVRAYVLDPGDRAGQLVPPGSAGELCLAGAGLARGYLGRPDLTAERFIPDPFSRVPGGRLYRTGDLVRLRTDGGLEHRGRIDSQVKVRGLRIELGEIEAVLRGHPAVREAAVTLREGQPGETRLAAWAAPATTTTPVTPADLRSWLRERLPAAAVPAEIAVLPELPRLSSGKIDRRALTVRTPQETEGGRPFEAPADEVEEKLAGLWRELLRVERVGRKDNFFDLGGHSLLATQLMVRIRDHFGVEIPLPDLFEAEDLAAQARGILALRLHDEDPGALAHLMAELDGLSEDEVASLLAEASGESPEDAA